MKTRDRILLTSLALFNEEGEPNVTTVDIASVMEISPGNLYYHFKGKEAIIESLYLTMEHELKELLNASDAGSIEAENIWFYLYVLFEAIYKYRFFYRNLSDIMNRYPDLAKKFRKLLQKKRETTLATLTLLEDNGITELDDVSQQNLANNIMLVLTYWLNFTELDEQATTNPTLTIHRGVFQVVSLVAPHLQADYREFYRDCETLFEAIVAELESES